MTSSSLTPVSPIRDFNGDTTINVLSTPAFCPTPAIHTTKLEPIEPTQLFPPVPSSPIPIKTINEFRWMSLSENISSETDSSTSGWSSPSPSGLSDSSDIVQFKWDNVMHFKWSRTP